MLSCQNNIKKIFILVLSIRPILNYLPFQTTRVHTCFFFSCNCVAQSLVFLVVFCRSLFVLFFYPLANEVAKGYSNATFRNILVNILQWILTKLGTYLVLRRIWNPFDFQGQRVKFLGEGIRHALHCSCFFGLCVVCQFLITYFIVFGLTQPGFEINTITSMLSNVVLHTSRTLTTHVYEAF